MTNETFVIGLGLALAPILYWGIRWLPGERWQILAAVPQRKMSRGTWTGVNLTSYCLGEGMGRLACISFGCCYGKPLDQLGPAARRLFEHFHLAFTGEMKKIAYSSGLDGAKVVPVQALSALVLVSSGLVGVLLFLNSRYAAAVLVTALVSQLWRAYSEGLRADYRGGHRVSAYRILSLAAAACAAARLMVLPGASRIRSQLDLGLELLWDPKVLLVVQALWLFVFLWLGRSMVTRSTLVMSVRKDRV